MRPGDFHHHEQLDEHHGGQEDRFITVASHPDDRGIVLTIAWTERESGEELITRLISARHSTAHEVRQYAKYIQEKTRA